MEISRKIFIENITRLRNYRGLTQSQAAELAGVTLGTYQKYEYGTAFPSPEKLDGLCLAFKVEISELFSTPLEQKKFPIDPEIAIARVAHGQERAPLILEIQDLLKELSQDDLETLKMSAENLRKLSQSKTSQKAE